MVNKKELSDKIIECLRDFHQKRLERLQNLKLKTVLKRKNPYLFKAVGIEKAAELVEKLLFAYLSSSDETIFGNCFFEPIAVFVSSGKTSEGEGSDLTIETPDTFKVIAVKSGPNPFNSSQKKRQNQEFMSLRSRVLKLKKHFDAILGFAYGYRKTEPTSERIYRELGGQAFWAELTGDEYFYMDLINLMKREVIASFRDEYSHEWARIVNDHTRDLLNDFCLPEGYIDWEKLLKYNSGA
jgi:hypothetical protein